MIQWLDLLMTLISINSPNWLALLLPSYSHWDLLFIFNSSFLNQPEPTSSHACNQQNYCCKTDRSLESSCTSSISWCLWSWYYRICLTNQWHHLITVQRIGPSGTTQNISLTIQEIQVQASLFASQLLLYYLFLLASWLTWLQFNSSDSLMNITINTKSILN